MNGEFRGLEERKRVKKTLQPNLKEDVGGAKETRTPDLLRAREALSQLSYRPAIGLGQYTGAA
jgi:hypothetical protein